MYALNIYYVLLQRTSKRGPCKEENPAFCYSTDRPQGHYAVFIVSQKLWRVAFESTSPSLCCDRCLERGTSTALSACWCLSRAIFYGNPKVQQMREERHLGWKWRRDERGEVDRNPESEERPAPRLVLNTRSSLGTGFFHSAQYSGDAPRELHV